MSAVSQAAQAPVSPPDSVSVLASAALQSPSVCGSFKIFIILSDNVLLFDPSAGEAPGPVRPPVRHHALRGALPHPQLVPRGSHQGDQIKDRYFLFYVLLFGKVETPAICRIKKV